MAHEGLTVSGVDQLFSMVECDPAFRNCSFDGADLAGFYAEELEFEECSLKGCDLSDLSCESLRISSSNLEHAIFESADILQSEFVKCVGGSANFQNAKMNFARIIGSDLSSSIFNWANLSGAD
ncbi:MAG TPA: hypothetical protein DEW32_02965, partial [Dehalococcoidia bacterium]|nr:hypothetical protein [Dehalococcoidia bacterium]